MNNIATDAVVIRVNSHRAGGKLATALGRRPQYWHTWQHGSCFAVLTANEANAVLPITGITRSRVKRDDLHQCWASEDRGRAGQEVGGD